MGPTSRLFDDPSDDPVLIAQARALGLLGEIAYYRGMAGATSALVPNPPMPIAEWAPRYAFIPTSKTTRGGPATLTPVQKGLARLLQQFGTEALVFLKCPRIGASTFAALLILYYACYEQSDSLLYERTDDKAQEFMKDKLMPILRASTHLKVLLRPDGKTGEQDTWDNRELMTGASIKARSITNTKNVKGVRGRFIVGEECGDDAWEPGKEGSKTNLVMRPGQEFGDGRVYLSGTPTVKGRCLVSAEFETSIKHVFRMDCPHCGRRQAFEAGTSAEPEVHRVRSSHTRLGRPGMRYVKSADGEIVDAWYECANAECPVSRIEDGQKNRMMEDTAPSSSWIPPARASAARSAPSSGRPIPRIRSPAGCTSARRTTGRGSTAPRRTVSASSRCGWACRTRRRPLRRPTRRTWRATSSFFRTASTSRPTRSSSSPRSTTRRAARTACREARWRSRRR
ncbi:phage terminase large subunit family protein [Aureimonas sp. N4]|uniref:phage terminase large subunit family protein n=1 Tax=Aureimonas sp. N4 TaxID=1638165 RepID=UPI000781E4BF|nr:phage terminase large subunit family protein [Aureimonas sp. N4]